MSSNEYNQLLKFLYFEGYAESYAEAEELLESMSDEEFEDLLERRYDRDEKLPSGRTPRQNMERQRGKHAANYMLRQRKTKDRHDQEAKSHFDRASTMDTVKKAQDAGEEPRDNPAWKNTIAARRRPRMQGEVPNERPGGLRAKATKAGGYRTLVRKEEIEMQEAWDEPSEKEQFRQSDEIAKNPKVQAERRAAMRARLKAQGKVPTKGGKPVFESVIEYLFVEGFADTIESAELMAENISEEWINEILEAHSFPLKPSELRSLRNISAMNRGDFSHVDRKKSAKKVEPKAKTEPEAEEPQPRKKRKLEFEVREEFDVVAEYLFVEGYADTIESAELMAENISAEWVDEIVTEMWPVNLSRVTKNSKTGKWEATSSGPVPTHPAAVANAAAKNRYETQKEIEAKWAKKDKEEKRRKK